MRSIREFYRYLNGRDVAIVGPAPHAEEPPAGSIVVRLNIDYRPMHVLYSIGARPGEEIEEPCNEDDLAEMQRCGMQWFVCRRRPGHRRLESFGPLLDASGVDWTAVPHAWTKALRTRFGHNPNTGVFAIFHLMESGLRSLYVTGMDLHQSGYRPGYLPDELAQRVVASTQGPTGEFAWPARIYRTDINRVGQAAQLRALAKRDPRLTLDATLTRRITELCR